MPASFTSAIGVLKTLVIALGAGLGIWGVINLMEDYGNDNPGQKVREKNAHQLQTALAHTDRAKHEERGFKQLD